MPVTTYPIEGKTDISYSTQYLNAQIDRLLSTLWGNKEEDDEFLNMIDKLPIVSTKENTLYKWKLLNGSNVI